MNDTKDCLDEYVPLKQVAHEWGVSTFFLKQEIKAGNLEAVKLAVYKIRRSTMNEYIKAHTVQPVSK